MRKIEGEKFGEWIVIKDCGLRSNNREIIWECRCSCGTIRNVKFKTLKNHSKPRSCGCSRKKRSKEIFEGNYEKTPGCWNWKGVISTHGYGKIGNSSLAHRRAFEYTYGKIPKDKQVCHKCDNRLCVNPGHLFLGSIGDNMKDKNFKNRQAKGSKIGTSKLNENQVREIRNRRDMGETYESLSIFFNVSWDTIRGIVKKRTWTHII